ncbi:MAG: hypothetical protein K1X82_10230 [Bacteroidia bacterium]|nr:hypothetical protein [Bacteroidia bacterium]
MKKNIPFTLGIAFLCWTSGLLAQVPNEPYNGREASKMPRIGLGYGIFTYFGDVRDNTFDHPFTSSSGGELTIERNINKYLNLYIRAVAGQITVNERSDTRNLNFRSNIYLGSVNVMYNFNNLYKRPKVLQPYISLGVGVFSFDSKTDLKAASGNPYYYWSDGSIRDMSETGPGAEGAKFISRDYKYETDLRQLNTEGRGKYSRLAFNVPIEFGALFRVSPRVSFKLGATYYYNFTNLIDNVTEQGTGVMQGKKGSDNFLYTSFGVSFNIDNPNKKDKEPTGDVIPDSLFADLDTKDSDGDGVPDFQDECAATPKGVLITKTGCPLDDDNDGIENFRDEEEKSTVPNPPVTVDGKNFTDDIIAASQPKDSVALAHALIEKAFANQMRLYGYPVKNFKQSLIDSLTRGMAAEDIADPKIDSLFKAIDQAYNQRQKEDKAQTVYLDANGKEVKSVEVPSVSTKEKERVAAEMKEAESKQMAKSEQVAEPKETEVPISTEPEPESLTAQEQKAIEKIVSKNDPAKENKQTQTTEAAKSTSANTKSEEVVAKSEPKATETTANTAQPKETVKAANAGKTTSGETVAESKSAPVETKSTPTETKSTPAETKSEATTTQPTTVATGKDLVPPQYKNFDFNGDGVLTGDEILKSIDLYTDGMLKMSSDDLFDMIDYYNSKMKNAKIIDYGGSKGVYIDGVLKFIKKDQLEETLTQKRKIPDSMRRVDMNNDGEITAKEVDEIIKKHKAGSKVYTAEFVNELIDWFFED